MSDFKYKPFEEMTPEDYKTVGFKAGLEVHQQLLTETKLFSRAKAGLYSKEYNAEILRHMRPTLSELGEYDGTALMEFKTKKDIIYRIKYDSTSTYEMDDTPPFEINSNALDIAMEIGMLYGASIVDELHIARKQYLDGSIPTGFQRTAITSMGGRIPFKDGYINLIQMSIEEDSCREVSDVGHKRVYLADRLGMPLIETVTHPEMKTPQEIAEVNQILRRLARSTGRVRTGIGSGRQDVNVSVRGGTRIEIKGVSRIPDIPRLAYNESMRQWNLLRLRDELHRRGIKEESFKADYQDVTKLLKKTRYLPVRSATDKGYKVNCVKLTGWKDLLTWETQTDTVFSKELSDRVRVIACITELPNIIHSDSPSEKLHSYEWQKIKKAVGAGDNDSIVLVWGSDEDAEMGAKEIIIRAQEATIGVPSETRQALIDGSTGFERILPGPQRMYPDTDLPPLIITEERLERIKEYMPEPIWDRENWYKEIGVPERLIKALAMSPFAETFKKAVNEFKVDPVLASVVIMDYPKRIKRKGKSISKINDELFLNIFKLYKDGKITKDTILYILEDSSEFGELNKTALRKIMLENEIKERVDLAFEQIQGVEILHPERTNKIIIGLVMDDLRRKADARIVSKLVNERLSKEEA
jgi:glutamyl-tRNA(Gln) amidotransferase subunit E